MWYVLDLQSERIIALPAAESLQSAKVMAIGACSNSFQESDDNEELQILLFNSAVQMSEFCKIIRTVTYICE